MKKIRLSVTGGKTESTIVCRQRVFTGVLAPMRGSLLGGGGLLLTDTNVFRLYRREIDRSLGGVPRFVMEAGEEHKNEETLFALLRAMAENGLRRNSKLVVLGGGVAGDLGGLAAGLYMRGIGCIQIPTTLLAQVDSSVGGKTAVDLCGVKNLIGMIRQPEAVYADPVFLRTLPRRELRCGLGEIVKHGALSAPLFEKLCAAEDLFDPAFLGSLVPENIAVKAEIVRKDPTEKGLRRCLNLGHTTGHAIELASGLSHGECVLWGLLFESMLSERHLAADGEFLGRLRSLCLSALEGETLPRMRVEGALLDKKNTAAEEVTLSVPVAAGKYEILRLPFAEYERELREIGEALQ